MGKASSAQTSFLGGEWSKSAQGRFDDPTYKSAMSICRNGLPIETGAWSRRSGTLHVAPTKDGAQARLVKFDFDQASPYNMVFSDNTLRFQIGPRYATNNDAVGVASISSTTPVQVVTDTAHGWVTGQYVEFDSLGITCAPLQNRQFKATRIDSTTISLADTTTTPGTSTSVLGDPSYVNVDLGATISSIQEVVTPYLQNTWSTLRAVQATANDNGSIESLSVLLNNSVAPQVLTLTSEPSGGVDATFELDPAVFIDGPYLDPVPHGAQITPSGVNGNVTLAINFTTYDATRSYANGDFVLYSAVNYQSLVDQNLNNQPDTHAGQWAPVSAGVAVGPSGFVATDIGRAMRLFSEPPLWDTQATYTTGNVVTFNGTYWSALKGMTGASPTTGDINPNQPGNAADTWALNAAGAVWTWGRIKSLGSGGAGSLVSVGTPIGSLTSGGGLAAAFNNNPTQVASNSANHVGATKTLHGAVYTTLVQSQYVGGDLHLAPKQIASATVYPATDTGFFSRDGLKSITSELGVLWRAATFRWYLRGKASAPSNSSDGTLLGSVTKSTPFFPGSIYPSTTPITIHSNDISTPWNFVWIELSITIEGYAQQAPGTTKDITLDVAVSEVNFYTPSGTGGTSVVVQVLGDPLLYTTPIRVWRMGLYSDTTGYPGVGCFHEGRLLIAGAQPNRFDGSRSNDVFNFAPTLPDGTVVGSSAISYTFNSKSQNTIVWMEPDLQGVIMGTQAGEWLVQATTINEPLTPTSIQAHQVTEVKCANIEPRRCEHTLAIVQANKRRIMEYFADVFSGKFSAPNLALKTKHLTTSGVAEIAYQQDLMPVIWVRKNDGSLAGSSYKRDSLMSSQGPSFNGWHRHDLGSGRLVTSLCVGPSVGGDLETLSLVTSAGVTDPFHIEIMADLWEETDALVDAQFLDDAVTPTSYVINGRASVTLNGLWHMNGQTVTVFGAGYDLGDYAVTSGSLTIPFGDGIQSGAGSGKFTADLVNSFTLTPCPFLVGFCFMSEGQQLRPMLPEQTGAQTGPALGLVRRAAAFAMLLASAVNRTFGVGTLTTATHEIRSQSPGSRELSKNQIFDGVLQDVLDDTGTSYNSHLAWSITRPLPLLIPATNSFIETKDK